MILASTSDLLKITTSAAADIHVQASWADKTSTSLTAGRTNTTFTSATTKTVVGSPGASTQRSVHSLHIANVHATDSNTLTIVHYDGTTNATVLVVTLNAGQTLEFDGRKFVRYGSSGGGGGDALTSDPLSQFAATTSAQLRGVISDETGSGLLVFATSPTLVTPVLGVASATSINKVAITAPATSATLTIADGKTLTCSNTLTFAGTDGSTVSLGAGGTVLYSGGALGTPSSGTLTNCTGLPLSTGITGFAANVITFLGTPSSANLAAVLTDETGSGKVVFSTAPTFDSTITVGTASGTTGAVLLNGTTSGTVTFTVAAAAGTHTVKLPTADGSANQVLKTDGSGQWGWVGISQTKVRQISVVFDGQGSTLTVGTKAYLSCPFAGTITKARILADQSGSCVVDIWKDTYANYPPTIADTITASAKPTLSSAQKNEDSTLTGWTTSVSAGDTFVFNVDSATTVTRVTVVLEITTST